MAADGRFISRGIRALALHGPMAEDASAQALHVLLLSLCGCLLLDLVIVQPRTTAALANALLLALGFASYGTALAILQKGAVRAASVIYIVGTWLIWTIVIVGNGGIHSPGVVFYVAIPISAAWLLGFRAVILSGIVCLASSLAMAVLEIKGVLLPAMFPGKPIGIWCGLLTAMTIAAVPAARVLQALRASLAQSRHAELALRRQQEALEELVKSRTSELVVALDEAQAAKQRADAANNAKTLFLANMSHELRTPLNAILGFSALIQQDASISGRQRENLEIIETSGRHLLELIDDVLDMSRIEAGAVRMDIAPVGLYVLAQDATDMLRERARSKGLELALEVTPAVPEGVRTDGGKLLHVLTNLINNAIKYTETGGVVVRVDAAPGEHAGEVRLRFDVQDTGIGITPETQAQIFEPFVQAASAAAKKGVGLGLSICRHFIGLLGGSIAVESAPGRGSRFRVEIPAAIATVTETTAPDVAEREVIGLEPGQPEYRILLVEDEPQNRVLLVQQLERAGFETRCAEDGAQAIEVFQSWRPDFIWMDLRLPVLGGLEATRRIRQMEPEGQRVKIAALTASAFSSQREQMLDAGFNDLLGKPYRAEKMFACMARHLGVRFRYGESTAAAFRYGPDAIRTGELAGISPVLRDELSTAVISLNSQRIALAIERITRENGAVGEELGRLASKFAFTPILKALASSKAPSTEVG
jgi:signal transduction histidine kinase/DNA-binding response OmpR family regulator